MSPAARGRTQGVERQRSSSIENSDPEQLAEVVAKAHRSPKSSRCRSPIRRRRR